MKRIAVIGASGYVGKAVVMLLENHYDLVKKDKDGTYDEVNKCDVGIVCVPTPMGEDGACDTSLVEQVVADLQTPLIWIRSTVPPHFTDYLIKKYNKRIVFSPEQIGEGKYWQPYKFNTDERESPWLVFGGDPKDTEEINNLIIPIMGACKRYIHTTPLNAEISKYMANVYFALKVTFANEMYEICKVLGADYWTVRDAWACDPRVDPMHTAVFPDARGFGGKCLPKDLNALIEASTAVGYDPKLLREVWESNKRFTK